MSQIQPTGSSPSIITTALLVVGVVFLVLANVAVALRLYARRIKATQLGWDEFFLGVSLVRLFLCLSVLILTEKGIVLGDLHQHMDRSKTRWHQHDEFAVSRSLDRVCARQYTSTTHFPALNCDLA